MACPATTSSSASWPSKPSAATLTLYLPGSSPSTLHLPFGVGEHATRLPPLASVSNTSAPARGTLVPAIRSAPPRLPVFSGSGFCSAPLATPGVVTGRQGEGVLVEDLRWDGLAVAGRRLELELQCRSLRCLVEAVTSRLRNVRSSHRALGVDGQLEDDVALDAVLLRVGRVRSVDETNQFGRHDDGFLGLLAVGRWTGRCAGATSGHRARSPVTGLRFGLLVLGARRPWPSGHAEGYEH